MQLSAERRRRWRQQHNRQRAARQAARQAASSDGAGAAAATAAAGGAARNAAAGLGNDTAAHASSNAEDRVRGWRAEGLEPFQLLPLWEGGTFDENYNSGREAIHFAAPAGTRRVLLEAVITGALMLTAVQR